MKTEQRYEIIDNVIGISKLPDNSIDLTMTSPPYDNLRTYNGYSFDFEKLAQRLYRVTKEGGIVVWVVGDATINGSETGTSFKQALYFKEVGFNLHDTMIYQKSTPIPQFKSKRYTSSFEYMFILSKGTPKTCNYLTDLCKQSGRIDKKYRGQMTSNEKYIGCELKTIKETKIKTNIWTYSQNNGIYHTLKHPAQFPEQLAKDHILSWSNEGDWVLDPFLGSGTTLKMCMELNRNGIGFEINKGYENIIRKRLKLDNAKLDAFNTSA